MQTEDLTEDDRRLLDSAETVLQERFEPGRHRCGAAVRSGTGEVYTAINVITDIGVVDAHAEPIAIGRAATAGETEIDAIVAVMYEDESVAESPRVVSACGACREFIYAIDPTARVIISHGDDLRAVRITELLPARP